MSRAALPEPVRRDLEALDAALAGEDSRFALLVADVRALAPRIDPAFEGRLGERVTGGFAPMPAPARPPRRARVLGWPRPLRYGGGFAALVAGVLLVVVLAGGSGRSGITPLSRSLPAGQSLVAPTAASSASSAVGGAGSAPAAHSAPAQPAQPPRLPTPLPTPLAPPAGGALQAPVRHQQTSAAITLATGTGQLDTVVGEVSRAATGAGGYVQSSQVNDGASGSGQADLLLTVPSGQLGSVLSELAQFGAVQSENRSAQDITGGYDAARQAVQDAVAARNALLRALARATSAGAIASLKARLALASANVVQTGNAFNSLAREAGESQVSVVVETRPAAAGGGFGIGGGWHDAGRVLSVALGVAVIAAAALVPFALLAAALILAGRGLRRSQRERALDAA
jgi:hypothetical protein